MNIFSLIFGIVALVIFAFEGVRVRRGDGGPGYWGYSYIGWGLFFTVAMLMAQFLYRVKLGHDLIFVN